MNQNHSWSLEKVSKIEFSYQIIVDLIKFELIHIDSVD
jgi:hypothetical protein